MKFVFVLLVNLMVVNLSFALSWNELSESQQQVLGFPTCTSTSTAHTTKELRIHQGLMHTGTA